MGFGCQFALNINWQRNMSLILCLVILSWRHIGIYTCGGKNQNYVFCIIFSYIYAESSYHNFYYDYIKDFITNKNYCDIWWIWNICLISHSKKNRAFFFFHLSTFYSFIVYFNATQTCCNSFYTQLPVLSQSIEYIVKVTVNLMDLKTEIITTKFVEVLRTIMYPLTMGLDIKRYITYHA